MITGMESDWGTVPLDLSQPDDVLVFSVAAVPSNADEDLIREAMKRISPNTLPGTFVFSRLAREGKLSPDDLEAVVNAIDVSNHNGLETAIELDRIGVLSVEQSDTLRNAAEALSNVPPRPEPLHVQNAAQALGH